MKTEVQRSERSILIDSRSIHASNGWREYVLNKATQALIQLMDTVHLPQASEGLRVKIEITEVREK